MIWYLIGFLQIKKKKFYLLYRASRDGDKCKDFHDRCDNKGKTFCIFLLQNDYIIGGYSSISWKNNGESKKDSNAFICSISNRERYELKDKYGYAVYHNDCCGPSFCGGYGNADIYIYNDCLRKRFGICFSKNAYNSSMKKLIGKECGADSYCDFKLEDYEVYQVM